MYGSNASPMYIAQGGASPQQYLFPVDNLPGRTPSPMDTQNNYNFPHPQAQAHNFPSTTPPLPLPLPNMQQLTSNIQISNIQMSHMSAGLSNYMVAQHKQNWTNVNVANATDEDNSNSHCNRETTFSNTFGSNMVDVDPNPTGLSSVLNLDSKELLTELNSAELAGLNLYDANLSENLTNNLSLSDIKTDMFKNDDQAQENMTDSFTRLTTATIDNICNLNSMYKPNIKE